MSDDGISPRKAKRTAERQLNKDEDPEGDGMESDGNAPGTFQRAPAEVLKARRIVKGRTRMASSTSFSAAGAFASLPGGSASGASSSSNPFANLAPKPAASNPFASLAASSPPSAGKGVLTSADAATPTSLLPSTTEPKNSETATLPTKNASAAAAGDCTGEKGSNSTTDKGENEAKQGIEETSSSAEGGAKETTASVPIIPGGTYDAADANAPRQTNGMGSGGSDTVADAASPTASAGGEATAEHPKDSKTPAQPGTKAKASAGEAWADPEREKPTTPSESGDAGEKSGQDGEDRAVAVGSGNKTTQGISAFAAAAAAVGGSGGVVSFAALGGSASPFQAHAKGASTTAPLSFAGFGLSSSTLDNKTGETPTVPPSFSTAGSANGTTGAASVFPPPVLSFGKSTGSPAFTSFNSFAAAPAGATWGSAQTAAGAGTIQKNGNEGTSNGSTDGVAKPPLEGLLDPSQILNGEETEECVRRVRAKLFRLAGKEWSELGIGLLKVLRRAEDADEGNDGGDDNGNAERTGASARLVMRREAGQQVVLNVSLQAQMRCMKQGEKALQMTCFTPDGPATYLVKVKTPEDAENLKNAIESNIPAEERSVP